jgi:hypothetical protein
MKGRERSCSIRNNLVQTRSILIFFIGISHINMLVLQSY